jgi:tRNA pseudouridine55 synthase
LRRHSVGDFGLTGATTDLDQVTVLPIAEAARRSFASTDLDQEQALDVRVGRKLTLAISDTTAVFAPDGEFLALYEPVDGQVAKPVAVFVG